MKRPGPAALMLGLCLTAGSLVTGCQESGESALGQRPTTYPAAGDSTALSPSDLTEPPGPAGRVALLAQARVATEATLSYDHRTLDRDIERARALMTPAFRKSYDRLARRLDSRAADQRAVAHAIVVDGAVSAATASRAQVLLFVDQTLRRADGDTRGTGSIAVVTMVRSAGRWLLGALETAPPKAPVTETRPVPGAVLAAGEAVAGAFADLSWKHPSADVARVLSLSTGEFLQQYADASDELVRRTVETRTTQHGSVVGAGLVRLTADSATVLVGVNGSTRVGGQAPVTRPLRLSITLTRRGAQWLASVVRVIPAPD